jgi:heme/copper-type cytochrome/quinol oxidase subunit 2
MKRTVIAIITLIVLLVSGWSIYNAISTAQTGPNPEEPLKSSPPQASESGVISNEDEVNIQL